MEHDNETERLKAPSTGRLAPSPTGFLHLGNAFAFLMAWLSVRSKAGRLILRMEDIDPDRSRLEYAEAILEDLSWLGLDWDEGPVSGAALSGSCVQSRRLGFYERALEALTAKGVVYPCYCTRKELRTLASAPHVGDEGAPYPGLCRRLTGEERMMREAAGRKPGLRLFTETEDAADLSFNDMILGFQDHTAETRGNDFAVRRPDGVVAYQLAVVVDDMDMGVTEVVRGRDLAVSTPRQILLYRLLGRLNSREKGLCPAYGHLPLIVDTQGERLAKRHKSLTLRALRDAGISSRAVVGYLAHLAGIRAERTPLAPQELVRGFALSAMAAKWKEGNLRLGEDLLEELAYRDRA